jgi:hypothetical protein
MILFKLGYLKICSKSMSLEELSWAVVSLSISTNLKFDKNVPGCKSLSALLWSTDAFITLRLPQ